MRSTLNCTILIATVFLVPIPVAAAEDATFGAQFHAAGTGNASSSRNATQTDASLRARNQKGIC
jgi:hypothetical protein